MKGRARGILELPPIYAENDRLPTLTNSSAHITGGNVALAVRLKGQMNLTVSPRLTLVELNGSFLVLRRTCSGQEHWTSIREAGIAGIIFISKEY